MSRPHWHSGWFSDVPEAFEYAKAELVRIWRDDILPLLATVWMFLVMALPIILAILVLWYLDWSGWRASPGFYTIG